MRLTATMFLTCAALVMVASVAHAGGSCSGGDGSSVVNHIFEKADRDGDGSLTSAEYDAAGLAGFGVSFEESDGNGDGATTFPEYLELYYRLHPTEGGHEA